MADNAVKMVSPVGDLIMIVYIQYNMAQISLKESATS